MSLGYIGEVRSVGFNFAPVGWLMCDGSLQAIANYETLFALIGTTYGGDGQTSFALPDLRGRVPLHQGQGNGLSPYVIGQTGGQTSVTLNNSTLPPHTHPLVCSNIAGTAATPANNYFAGSQADIYTVAPPITALGAMASVVGLAGGSQPHDNTQPYLAVTYIICTQGLYPNQS